MNFNHEDNVRRRIGIGEAERCRGELIAEDDAQYAHWVFISEQLKRSRCYSITPGFRYTPGVDNGSPEAYIITVSWIWLIG